MTGGCGGLAVPLVCADGADEVLDGRVVGTSGDGNKANVAVHRWLDQRPRECAMAEMHVLRHEGDAAAGGNHHLDPIFPLAAIDDP